MEGKTRVMIKHDDNHYKEYKKGSVGYIDGYVRGGTDAPYACVVIGESVHMVPLHSLKVIKVVK